MSRHSHWAKIKHDKGAADKKRGALFSKILRGIQVAARGGVDPAANFKLRLAIEQAKAAAIPKDTIERAISRGSGQDKETAQMTEEIFEGFAPGGAAIIIEAVTDNKNRVLQDLKYLFNKLGGNLGSAGSVLWQFKRQGIIRLPSFEEINKKNNQPREEVEMRLIEAGAEDIIVEDEGLSVMVKPGELKSVEEKIRKMNLTPDYVGLDWLPKERVAIKEEARGLFEELQEELDNMEDVSDYYTNAL